MRVAIISDLHDNLDSWRKIKEILNFQKIPHLIIAGDITGVKTIDKIAKDFGGSIHAVFGNMDQQTEIMKIRAEKYSHLNVYGFNGQAMIGGKNFLINHYQQEAEAYADKVGKIDIVCCGHTHEKKFRRTDEYMIINPGTAGGIFQAATFAVYDTDQDQVKFIEI